MEIGDSTRNSMLVSDSDICRGAVTICFRDHQEIPQQCKVKDNDLLLK